MYLNLLLPTPSLTSILSLLVCSVLSDGSGVAICFSGHLKTFEFFPSMKINVMSHLVESISAGSTVKNSIFGHVTLEEESKKERIIKLVRDAFNPLDLIVEIDSATVAQVNLSVPLPTQKDMAKHIGYIWQHNPLHAVTMAHRQYIKVTFIYPILYLFFRHAMDYLFFLLWCVIAICVYTPLPPPLSHYTPSTRSLSVSQWLRNMRGIESKECFLGLCEPVGITFGFVTYLLFCLFQMIVFG